MQADSNDGQLGAYLFKRTIPMEYLSDYTASELIGMWNDKIIVSQASISAELVEALLDAGAKAIVAPSNEDPDNFISAGRRGRYLSVLCGVLSCIVRCWRRCTCGKILQRGDSTFL